MFPFHSFLETVTGILVENSDYANWANVSCLTSSSTLLADASEIASAIKFFNISSPSITNLVVTSEAAVTSSSENVTNCQYYGIWWDDVTLQSSIVADVVLQAVGITHNNDALLSVSIFWKNVAFLGTSVSDLSATSTSSTNVRGGEAVGIYFQYTQYTDSSLRDWTIEAQGNVESNDTATGIEWVFFFFSFLIHYYFVLFSFLFSFIYFHSPFFFFHTSVLCFLHQHILINHYVRCNIRD